MEGINFGADRESVLVGLIEGLPNSERDAFRRAARTLKRIRATDPDTDTIPVVMTQLEKEFARLGNCPDYGVGLDVYILSNQLNLLLIQRGLDTETLFPANDGWPGEQTLARIAVGLVRTIQEQEPEGP